jgi:hypothetical protein
MKVGDGNNSSDPAELLERMREAHRQAEADSVDASRLAEQSGATEATGSVEAAGASNGASEAVDGLEQRLLDTAASVLDGAFDSTDDVRHAVVEAIVTERYAETLGPAETEQITRTLTLTLTDDPAFRQEVDNMLVHAASELARGAD